jgi:hypothetical protein
VQRDELLHAGRNALRRLEQVLTDVVVDDLGADLLRLGEAELLEKADKFLERLGEGGQVQDGSFRRRVRKTELLRQEGLSGFRARLSGLTDQSMAAVKRSPNRTANWDLAMDHSRGGMIHCFSERFKTRKRSLVAASSLGKWPLARTARRSLEFSASIAFVV